MSASNSIIPELVAAVVGSEVDNDEDKIKTKHNINNKKMINGCNSGDGLHVVHVSTQSQAIASPATTWRKSTSIKENKYLYTFWSGAHRNGTVEENDLRTLMLMTQKWNDDNLFELNTKEWDRFYSFPRLHLSTKIDEDQLDPFVLQPSLFLRNNVPPTIYFSTKLTNDSRQPIGLPRTLQSLFRWKISNITPNSIRNCISFMKFDVIKPSNTVENCYVGCWCKHMLTAEFSHLEEWKKVNHYPGSFHLGRKDKLSCRLKQANQRFASESFEEFHPATFVLPRDYEELKIYWEESPSKLFIMKPPASARGNGIQVINHISQIPSNALELPPRVEGQPVKKSTLIVQQYISNPCLLENGKKFDLRIYVLLTSIDPLRIYVYDEGLVRFASSKYTSQEEGIIDQYMHLTNYFINKKNTEYKINNDCDSLCGSKWTLKRFWRYLRDHYPQVDVDKLWDQIIDIIIKAFICCEGPISRLSHLHCRNDYSSYELFGFDIILDEFFKPWILEVNITPSLKSESDLDTSVKYSVIKDMFNIVGYNLPPPTNEQALGMNGLRSSRLFFDERYYTENLTKRDKIKHSKFIKMFKLDNEKTLGNELIKIIRQANKMSNPSSQVPKIESLEIDGYHRNECQESTNHIASQIPGNESQFSALACESILDDLSQNDIRVLMLAEDELSRCGRFRRIFPSATSAGYLKCFDKPRYYNLLLNAWEDKFRDDRLEGIKHLSVLANFLD